MTRRSKYNSEFGTSVSSALAEADLTQNQLASLIHRSPSYLNQVMTGRKKPDAEWANIVASALQMQREQRVNLHYAVAKDIGLDLTKE